MGNCVGTISLLKMHLIAKVESVNGGFYFFLDLPSYNLIHNSLLFVGGSSEIDTSRFNALMPHKVCKQRYVIELFEEVLGVSMPE